MFAGDPAGARVIVLGDTDYYYNRAGWGPARERAWRYLDWFWRRYFPWWKRKEAVVFLQPSLGGWSTGGGSENIVWLDGDKVYPTSISGFGDRLPRYRRGPFFAALKEAIRTATERNRLLKQTRSPERAQALVQLSLTHDRFSPTDGERWLMFPFYHLAEIGHGLRHPSPAEQAAVISALASARDDGDRIKLLRLAGLIPLPPDGFTAVSKFAGRATP